MSKHIKNISDILESNQELQETHKDIRKLLKLKERADLKKDHVLNLCFLDFLPKVQLRLHQ